MCLMADQMRVLKQRLNEMVPNLKIFLDVDDLKSGKGAESVDTSLNILVMVSDGYFRSPNCAHMATQGQNEHGTTHYILMIVAMANY